MLLTKDASNFVSPLTLSTLSSNDVLIDFSDESGNKWNNHVELSLWADVFLIAPATANTISKMASGLCDNMLLATFLSCTRPVFCAPAMDRDMYLNRATVKNLQILKKRGIKILEVESGELASGLYGLGRMRDVNKMFHRLSKRQQDCAIFRIQQLEQSQQESQDLIKQIKEENEKMLKSLQNSALCSDISFNHKSKSKAKLSQS